MAKVMRARELFRMGAFNVCNIIKQADGSTVYSCDGERAPAPFEFRVRDMGTEREELIHDPVVEPRRSV